MRKRRSRLRRPYGWYLRQCQCECRCHLSLRCRLRMSDAVLIIVYLADRAGRRGLTSREVKRIFNMSELTRLYGVTTEGSMLACLNNRNQNSPFEGGRCLRADMDFAPDRRKYVITRFGKERARDLITLLTGQNKGVRSRV